MKEPVIRVKDISKRYRIGLMEQKSDTLTGKLINVLKAPLKNYRRLRDLSSFEKNNSNVHWALQNISFDVYEGEVLGIIGHNGAGKSTLLKILSRITPPTTGEIEITGRVSSLLEVGTGFHPELTGRDNIYMNGTIHGMRRKEITAKIEEIIEFSGIGKYIDTPVKFYSSGMKVRLGFAVAAHLEPEILIIDEVLAVGDVEFQKRCIGKMQDVAASGRTVLFVSHDMGAVKNLCPKTIILKGGKIFDIDDSEKAILKYIEDSTTHGLIPKTGNNIAGLREIRIQNNVITGKCVLENKKSLKIELDIDFANEDMDVTFGFDIYNGFGTKIIHLRSDSEGKFRMKKGFNTLDTLMDFVPLLSGSYHVNGWIAEYKGKRIWESNDLFLFEVLPDNSFYDHQGHLKNALLVPGVKFEVRS